jgi:ketosteroid isomerase-like protein
MTPLELMRRYLDAAHAGDFETAYDFFADDILFHIPGRGPFAGDHRGKQAAIDYITRARALSEGGKVELELIDTLSSGDRVAFMLRERFHVDGWVVDIRRCNVYRVAGEKIVEVSIFEADQYAVDELFES